MLNRINNPFECGYANDRRVPFTNACLSFMLRDVVHSGELRPDNPIQMALPAGTTQTGEELSWKSWSTAARRLYRTADISPIWEKLGKGGQMKGMRGGRGRRFLRLPLLQNPVGGAGVSFFPY